MADALGLGEPGPSDLKLSSGHGGNAGGNGGDNPHPKKSMVKKRTKTGCLTCRKRRIKCDEGRPTCNNCLKSKRLCEGYSQRVIFKDPLGAYPYQGDPSLYPQQYISYHQLPQQITSARSSHGPLAVLAPKPSTFNQYPYRNPYSYGPLHSNQAEPTHITPSPNQGYYYPQNDTQSNTIGTPIGIPMGSAFSFMTTTPTQIGQLPPNLGNQPPPYPSMIPNTSSGSQVIDLVGEKDHSAPCMNEDYSEIDEDASLVASDDEDNNGALAFWPEFLGILSEYTTIPESIPELGNMTSRECLWNFITVTGPSMSLYEREPFDPRQKPQDMAQGSKVGGESNRLWGLHFPMLAFRHPGLLHAMLALSSLQTAKQNRLAPYTAIKHYHLAMRRVAKNLGPLRRKHPATLAATLLLAYFEVWASDHQKWCKHLLGARQLFSSIDLFDMSRKCLRLKMLKARRFAAQHFGLPDTDQPPEDPEMLDFNLISIIHGTNIQKTDYNLGAENPFDYATNRVSDQDAENYDNVRDLFWWYCKMDVYQSMLGGTKLLMSYAHWSQCPPRAPVGMTEMMYGTYDHLILLLGRLADFASTDLPRKRAAIRAKGAPAPGSSPPSFPGMIPVENSVQVPMGFSPPREASPPSEASEETDPELNYQRAVAQWEEIEAAFRVFEERIEHVFRPLSSEFSDRRDPPFGDAVQYQTYPVAGIWMNYYMGLIHLHRSHPAMPPAAMQAAGFAARKTEQYATMIGRIAIGMVGDLSTTTKVSTVVGAALIESAFCLFWAAVQFQNTDQRHWVVQRMHDITRLTGWQSAIQIADGCESSWTRSAQLGRGPPYSPLFPTQVSYSIWQNPRRLDRWIHEVPIDQRVVMTVDQGPHFALGLLEAEGDDTVMELYRGSG